VGARVSHAKRATARLGRPCSLAPVLRNDGRSTEREGVLPLGESSPKTRRAAFSENVSIDGVPRLRD
jgi:hypothetical protein